MMAAFEALSTLLSGPLWVFICVLSRIGPAVTLMPPIHGSMIPNRVKAMLALMIAASVTPIVMLNAIEMPQHLLDLVLALAKEALLGLMFGTSVLMVITCLQVGSQIVGSLSSMDLAQSADPSTQEQVSVLTQLMSLFAMVLFVLLGGHRVMMGACLDSFQQYPAGGVLAEGRWLMHLQQLIVHSLALGIRASAPPAIALLLANFVTALIGRTLPQINIMAIGFNVNVTVLLLILVLSVSSIGWVFQTELTEWVERTNSIFPRSQ